MKTLINRAFTAVLLTAAIGFASQSFLAPDAQARKAHNQASVNPDHIGVSTPAAVSFPTNPTDEQIIHLLNRVTFGPTAEDVELVKKIGIQAYLDRQLDPRSIELPDNLIEKVKQSQALTSSPVDLMAEYGAEAMRKKAKADGVDDKKEIQKQVREAYKKFHVEVTEARLERNVESPRQLEEVMTDFWFNHFNISMDKGLDHILVGSFEQQAIRPYALGKFRDLLGATAHHPAMLFYLDNWQNTDPNSRGARGRFKGINENYARELMELHTLGVDGGYSQQDVVALAHILTGLGMAPAKLVESGVVQTNPFGSYFDRNRHDFSDKTLLGQTVRGSGESEIEQALDMLAKHPSTAHHLSYQIAQYFVSDKPPEALVDRLTKTYMRTDGDIKEVMATLLHSPEFWDSSNVANKYKSPYHYAVSVLRASGAQLSNAKRIDQFCRQLGQPLYGCLTPDGYKNTQEAWLNSDGLLKRIAFAGAVARGQVGSTPPDEVQRVQTAVGPKLGDKTEAAIADAKGVQKAALLLGSPEFMNY